MVIYCFLFIIGDKCLYYNHCKITDWRWNFYNYLTASGKNNEIKFIKIFEVDRKIYRKYIDFNKLISRKWNRVKLVHVWVGFLWCTSVINSAAHIDDVCVHVCPHLLFILAFPTIENAHFKSIESQFQFICPHFGSINSNCALRYFV